MKVSRRQFLLGTGTVALATGGAVLAQGETRALVQTECAEIHAKMVDTYRDLARSARFTATNVASAAMNVACPCCGDPLFKFLG